MPDEFEQELLSDISAAEQYGEGDLAIEWRLELKSYRAAKQRTVLEGQPWNRSSAVTTGAQAIVISPMGVGVTDALNEAQQHGVRIVFVDNTIPGVVPDAVAATNKVKRGEAADAYIESQLKSGDTIGLLEAVRGVPNLDQRIDGVKAALEGTGVKVVIGAQQTLCDTKAGAPSEFDS